MSIRFGTKFSFDFTGLVFKQRSLYNDLSLWYIVAIQKGGIPMHLDPKSIGAMIRARRTSASLTQADLAERLHVSAQSVSNWERGVSHS